MKRIAGTVVLAMLYHGAAAEEVRYVGKPDCRVMDLEKDTEGVEVRWDGACKDGYADGEGKLEFILEQKTLRRYTGQVRAGAPNGTGYMARHDGSIMEGAFKDGKLEGNGVRLNWFGRHALCDEVSVRV